MGLVAALAFGETACGAVMKTFYVSSAGDDANPGTKDQPFGTIGRAKDAVRQSNREMTGDIVVILGGGTYSISEPMVFDHRDSAAGGHTIVYRSADSEQAVISGGQRITGWQSDADGRWKAPAKLGNFRQLYVDGTRAVRARGGALPGAELHGKDGYKTTAVEKLVELQGTLDQPVENVHFVGITFAEAGWLLPSEIGFVDVQANFLLNWKDPMRRAQGLTTVASSTTISTMS